MKEKKEIVMSFVEIDHEVRIRLLEQLIKDNKSQFHWVMGTILGQMALTITLFGGIILHLAKLI